MNRNQEFYDAVPAPGGVRLVPKGKMAQAMRRLYPNTRFWDAGMPLPPMNNLNVPYRAKAKRPSEDSRRRAKDQQLPDDDYAESDIDESQHQEPDGDEAWQVLAEVPAPPDGYILNLYQEEDDEDGTPGVVFLVLEPDVGRRDDPTLNTSDRMLRHRISDGKDPTLVRMNQINRGYHVRDADTVSSTLIRHRPLRGERLELRGPNEFGSWDLVLISWAPGEHMIINPRGSQELDDSDEGEPSAASWLPQPEKDDPLQLQQPNPTFRDSYRVHESVQLRNQNAANRAFWARR